MCSIANSFITQVNHNLGNRSVEELIDKEYLSQLPSPKGPGLQEPN